MSNKLHLISVLLASGLAWMGCVQKMGTEGHLRPNIVDRAPPSGTVARGTLQEKATFSERNPFPISQALLYRGRERYNVYCSPCHDYTGGGNGMIVQRGFLSPPSYHIDRLRKAPDRHFFNVITDGYGAMYSYGDRVTPADRWAIVAYIRALQLSQNFLLASKKKELRPEDVANLEGTQQ